MGEFREMCDCHTMLAERKWLWKTLSRHGTVKRDASLCSSMSDTMIMDSIASFLVLPNRLLIPLVPDLHEAAELRSPIPRVRETLCSGAAVVRTFLGALSLANVCLLPSRVSSASI